MFNTFGDESHDLTLAKREKIQMKQRLIELNNINTIQLNPWNDDNSKSSVYFENQSSLTFSKPYLKNPAIIKYTMPRQQAKKQKSKISFDLKKIYPNYLPKQQMKKIQGRKKIISQISQLQRMSKTISVNNFEGDKILGLNESIQSKQKVLEKDQKRHRTTINNPMYGKFCINYNAEKQPKKKDLNEAASAKFDNLSIKEIIKFRSRMSTLSMDRADPERVKSIHEVRKRLKSTSEIMRRKEESQENLIHENQLRPDKEIFISSRKEERSQKMLEQVNSSHLKAISPIIEGEVNKQTSSCEKFKLGQRKNIYIGFRKFFNQGLNSRQQSLQRKQSVPTSIVNLDALMERGEGKTIKRFQKFEEHVFQKSFNLNNN